MVILYAALAGVVGDKLYLVQSDVAKAATAVTASGVLGYGASLIGFSITYTSLASDFVSHKSHYHSSLANRFLSEDDQFASPNSRLEAFSLCLCWHDRPYHPLSDIRCRLPACGLLHPRLGNGFQHWCP